MLELAQTCPKLHSLYIADIRILALSEHCSQLKSLNIKKCSKVTETAILYLLQQCPDLTDLTLADVCHSEEIRTILHRNIELCENLFYILYSDGSYISTTTATTTIAGYNFTDCKINAL